MLDGSAGYTSLRIDYLTVICSRSGVLTVYADLFIAAVALTREQNPSVILASKSFARTHLSNVWTFFHTGVMVGFQS